MSEQAEPMNFGFMSLSPDLQADLAEQAIAIEVQTLRVEVQRWRHGFAEAERYFDQVNEPDEASIGENGQRRELIATGAAAYRERLRRHFR